MSGQGIAFYIFSFLTLLCGVLVITKRNPITCAMCLVLCIVSLAGLFVLLNAFFLAAVQVLVYAGAVMVLFLFVIMLLDLKEEVGRRLKLAQGIAGLVAVATVLFLVVRIIWDSKPGASLKPAALAGGTADLGRLLFTNYLLPFEILSVLLLVAMLGVILLSKKELK
jgi:NADH-quinone oxidoreductase subunit J